MYFIILVVFILDIFIIYIDPYISMKQDQNFKKKIEASKTTETSNGCTLTYHNYPNKVLVSFTGTVVEADVNYINITIHSTANTLILKNVSKILSFNIEVENIQFINSSYYEENGVIFNDKKEVCFIIKKLRIKELISLADNFSIARTALNSFSNATYFQFSRQKGFIRISKPSDEKLRNIKLVIPSKIENVEIKGVEINCPQIEYIYISSNIKHMILERQVNFNHIKLAKDQKYLKIRDNRLVYRLYNTFVVSYEDSKNVKNSTKFVYSPTFSMSKNRVFCRMQKK